LLGNPELVASVLADVETSLLAEPEKVLFHFIRKVNHDSVSIQPADIAALHEAGFTDEPSTMRLPSAHCSISTTGGSTRAASTR